MSDTWPAALAVSTSRLRRQLSLLVRQGYRGATFSDAVHAQGHAKTLVVTFDDGYRSVLELALPILSDLGLPGTIFVPTALIGDGQPLLWPGIDHWADGPHHEELHGMSWEELDRLAGLGWEVGSHTETHPRLTGCDHAHLHRELTASRRTCEERLNRPCRSVAYPYGDVDPRVVQAAEAAGYSAAAALPRRLYRPRPLEWPRVGVYRADHLARFCAKTSATSRRVRAATQGRFAERPPR